jgi:hypothetical protein
VKRADRRERRSEASREQPSEARRPGAGRRARPPQEPRASFVGPILRDLAILLAVFGITVGIAELAGAANLGVSLGIGQVAFALALIVLLSRD